MKRIFLLPIFTTLFLGAEAQIKVYTGGNTCIGSVSHTPASFLDVYSSTSPGSSTQFANSTLSHFYGTETKARWGIGRDYLASAQAAIAFGPGGTTDLDTYIGRDGSGNLVFQTSSSPSTHNTRLIITSGGDVNLNGGSNTYQIGGNKVLSNKNISTCIFVGTDAGSNNTATHNSALGYRALYTLGTSSCTPNNAFGYKALYSCTVGGYFNDAFGDSALYANTSGASNIGFGAWALTGNTAGSNNVVVGTKAMQSNSTGSGNTAMGFATLNKNTTSGNTAFGYEALFNNTTGSNNTAIGGGGVGSTNTTGSNNIYIGYGANCNAGTYNNSIAIGQGASVTASNYVIIGNISTTNIGGWVNWTNYSDERVKKDVQENVPGLAFIKKLRPVTYHFNPDQVATIMKIPDSLRLLNSENAKSKILHTGFIAQEVEKAAQDLNYDFSGIHRPADNGLHGLRYSEFVVPMVKAIQEQQAQLDSLKQILTVTKVGQRVMQNAGGTTDPKNGGFSSTLPSDQRAVLYQNTPNPFSQVTTIKCFIPSESKTAALMIFDMNGTLKKNTAINNRGEVSLPILGKELIAGMYYYSLIIDSVEIDTKKMILTEQ